MPDNQPTAFVIMPFEEGLNEVYSLFVAETLREAGYAVVRADDMKTQQNILKDIVTGIATADLIVADLTDSNPNVFYELGLAHALRRPVILLAQDIGELPFDLRSYRVIPYSRHFAKITEAKSQLLQIARQARSGDLSFGSPVSDFLGPVCADTAVGSWHVESAESGFLDQLVALEDGLKGLTKSTIEHSQDLETIGALTTQSTEQLEKAVARHDSRGARAILMALANKTSDLAERLSVRNAQYVAGLGETRNALEFVVGVQSPDSAETIRGLPNMEKTFSRASKRLAAELDRFVGNIDQTISMMSRARKIGAGKLQQQVAPPMHAPEA